MPRPVAAIETEISVLESRLSSADSFTRSAGSDGVSLTSEGRRDLERRLDHLYVQLDRASGRSPRASRGRVRGL